MRMKKNDLNKVKETIGLQQIRLLGLNNPLYYNEKYFESRNLELIDAVLLDIQLRDDTDSTNEQSDDNPKVLVGNKADTNAVKASDGVDQDSVPQKSLFTLKERKKRVKAIATIPYVGSVDDNILTIEAQIKGILIAGKPRSCTVCESPEVMQNKQLTDITIWRKTLMSGIQGK